MALTRTVFSALNKKFFCEIRSATNKVISDHVDLP